MADEYEFNDASPEKPHPLDDITNVQQLRHNALLRQVFENLENSPQSRLSKLPAWVFEALSDQMTFSVLKLSYQNRSPESVEDFYVRQGRIKTYEGLAVFFSQQAADRRKAAEGEGGQ